MIYPSTFSGKPHGTARANATNTLTHVFDWATSITPTILSLAGVTPLENRYAGKPLRPF